MAAHDATALTQKHDKTANDHRSILMAATLLDRRAVLNRRLAPAVVVLGVAIGIWLVSGVSVTDVGLFLGYEFVFVALPGVALLWVLRGRRTWLLTSLALGVPLGHVLEILAFSATAAAGMRGLYVLYPVVVVAPCAALIWKRRITLQPRSAAPMSGRLIWTASLTLSLGLVYLALMFFPNAPLPSSRVSVAYSPDFVYQISKIAEVLYHWPPTNPGLSGVPLPYEWFVFYHMAAVSQITHISIPTLALRLDFVPLIIVIGCQLLTAGRALAGAAWTGVIAIAIVFLLGPLDLTTDSAGPPFFIVFANHVWGSWTFPFGLIFFLGLLLLIGERLRSRSWRSRADLGSWVLVALLMVGASGAKATVLPVLLVGTALYVAASSLARRRVPNLGAVLMLGLEAVIFVVTFLVIYRGGAAYTGIDPLAALSQTLPVVDASGLQVAALRAIVLPVAYAAGLSGMLLPLAGIFYLLRRPHRKRLRTHALCLCMLGAGLLVGNVIHQKGYSELYFQETGYIAGCIVAADGFRLACVDIGSALPLSRRAAVIAGAGWIATLALVVIATAATIDHAAAIVVIYGVLVVGGGVFVVTWALIARARSRPRSGYAALGLIPLLGASILASPIELAPAARRLVTGAPITATQPDPQVVRGLTPGLLSALQWLQDNTPLSAVIAVSNHWIDPAQQVGLYYYYSAFSERQVFVEGYDPVRYQVSPYTPESANLNYRKALNNAVFDDADPDALRVLTQQYSVRYLFIDTLDDHDADDPMVPQLGRVVYSNADAVIVEVGP